MKIPANKIVAILAITTALGASGWLLSLQFKKECRFTQFPSLDKRKTYVTEKAPHQEMISCKRRLSKLEEQQQLIVKELVMVRNRLADSTVLENQESDNVKEPISGRTEDQKSKDIINGYEVTFSQELDDSEWSNRTEELIGEALDNDSTQGSNLLSVHCPRCVG